MLRRSAGHRSFDRLYNLDGHARVALLRAFEMEPRLLAAVDRVVLRNKEKRRLVGP